MLPSDRTLNILKLGVGTHNWMYVRKKSFNVSCTWYKSLYVTFLFDHIGIHQRTIKQQIMVSVVFVRPIWTPQVLSEVKWKCIRMSLILEQKVKSYVSFLEACFNLISGSSLSMKIQIMVRKIAENLGLKSLLRKVKFI